MKPEDITGALLKNVDDSINRQIWGEHYTAVANPQPGPSLTFERLMQTYEYFKPETLVINGERHELYGWKVHRDGAVPEGVIILTEKMKPGSTELGKLVMLFVNEGKGVIYDPAKVKPEPPKEDFTGIGYQRWRDYALFTPQLFVNMPLVVRARQVIREQWPELICGPDNFFDVFDIIED